MVDITDKDVTKREAVAVSRVVMQPETMRRIKDGTMRKGDVLAVAQVTGRSKRVKEWFEVIYFNVCPLFQKVRLHTKL
jgi:cyclic pyranopterin phosphate synthase